MITISPCLTPITAHRSHHHSSPPITIVHQPITPSSMIIIPSLFFNLITDLQLPSPPFTPITAIITHHSPSLIIKPSPLFILITSHYYSTPRITPHHHSSPSPPIQNATPHPLTPNHPVNINNYHTIIPQTPSPRLMPITAIIPHQPTTSYLQSTLINPISTHLTHYHASPT